VSTVLLTTAQSLQLRMVYNIKRRGETTTSANNDRSWLAENGFLEWQTGSGWQVAPAGHAWVETNP